MRLIDADACIDYIRNNNQHAWEALAYAPTIDAVQVVRCKDCIFCDRGEAINFCDYLEFRCHDEDFCSRGKRKGGDTE